MTLQQKEYLALSMMDFEKYHKSTKFSFKWAPEERQNLLYNTPIIAGSNAFLRRELLKRTKPVNVSYG